MCKFFSFVTYQGTKYYCDDLIRETESNPDSHTRICQLFKVPEDKCNKYEVIHGKLIVDNIEDNTELLEDIQHWVNNFVASPQFERILIVSKQLHPNAIEAQIELALNDEDWSVRYVAAQHPNMTEKLLELALRDEDWRVRHAVVQHPNMTEKLLELTLKDESWQVRHKVVQHPNMTEPLLDLALNDEDCEISRVAELSLSRIKNS